CGGAQWRAQGQGARLLSSCETWSPGGEVWTLEEPGLPSPRRGLSLTSLGEGEGSGKDGGSLLVVGAGDTVLRGTPADFEPELEAPELMRTAHTVSRLNDGSLLVVGGHHRSTNAIAQTVWLRDPEGAWYAAGQQN